MDLWKDTNSNKKCKKLDLDKYKSRISPIRQIANAKTPQTRSIPVLINLQRRLRYQILSTVGDKRKQYKEKGLKPAKPQHHRKFQHTQ